MLETASAIRYVTPLREGGSLPGIVEADDDGIYVLKLRGAGQGLRVLVAEVVVGQLARALGIRVPVLKAVDLDIQIAKYEADQEVQDLLTASVGLNLGVDFPRGPSAMTGPDRHRRGMPRTSSGSTPSPPTWTAPGTTPTCSCGTARPGPSTTAPRSTSSTRGRVLVPTRTGSRAQPFDASQHVLREVAGDLAATTHAEASQRVDEALLTRVLAAVPDEWLEPAPGLDDPAAVRTAYISSLLARLGSWTAWLPAGGATVSTARVGYQYVVLRCVPRVDRDEFINVGISTSSWASSTRSSRRGCPSSRATW